jgi:hypothetical protein
VKCTYATFHHEKQHTGKDVSMNVYTTDANPNLIQPPRCPVDEVCKELLTANLTRETWSNLEYNFDIVVSMC